MRLDNYPMQLNQKKSIRQPSFGHQCNMKQTMLLTKNLTEFLSQNTGPVIPTMLLLSPAGKLLASSSPLPASRLRTQATLAYSLWTIYLPSISSISAALPPTMAEVSSFEIDSSSHRTTAQQQLSTITIQLTNGLMMIRALDCDLLYVALNISDINPSPPISLSAVQTPPTSSRGDGSGCDSVNDIEGLANSEGQISDIVEFKKLSDDVGRWLDQQLAGFALYKGDGRL
ncbi:hypothetical protein GcM1_240057 [Golovinomyces cichoracearum]|uniref:Uncharacterized protein n=1 Tax=Golovinomyces cichoracearum TaxID=62708 RepID=A0A420IIC1_9PEZI|nr:hypothetical protein GcM1_240057 [Golovinomyces cichoracearum]